ncbi:MAG: MBL fold protein, partial [Candidatus Parabeggiatoa sp. nov. 3]
MPNYYVLDVGHGNSTVLVDTDGVIVIDAGPKTKLLEFLLDHNIHEIDVLLLSHADKDHIAGVIGLLASEEIRLKRVYLNS